MPLDDLAWRFSDLIFNGCFPSTVHDQLAGELVKARLMKASGRFDEALEVVDKTLDRLPETPLVFSYSGRSGSTLAWLIAVAGSTRATARIILVGRFDIVVSVDSTGVKLGFSEPTE